MSNTEESERANATTFGTVITLSCAVVYLHSLSAEFTESWWAKVDKLCPLWTWCRFDGVAPSDGGRGVPRVLELEL